MKKGSSLFVLILFSSFLFTNCSKKNSTTTPPSADTTATSQAIISGNWIISSYKQRTENKTSLFANVVFTFSANGSLTADGNGKTVTGTWSFSPSSVGYYGGPPTKASFTLNLGTSTPFKNLNRTWNNDSLSKNFISLLNPEPLDSEFVHFSKL